LFAVISDDYGALSATHFNVPDMRGLFVRGWANGESDDPDRASRTDRGDGTTGDNVGTKQDDEFKSHTHKGKNQTADANNADGDTVWVNDNAVGVYGSGSGGGGGGPVGDRNFLTDSGGNETRPKNIAMMYIIRAV
jgi:microcystin-dependent protein